MCKLGLLRFGYLGKCSTCVCESLNTKGEIITLNTLFYVLISLWLGGFKSKVKYVT
jgi:hypothetical protein